MNPVVTLRRGLVELSRLLITVPLCEQPNTSTVCECGGLLAYFGERWHHVEACVRCFASARPCRNTHRHIACIDAHPLVCAHGGCREAVDLEVECAHGLTKRTCCGCCWITTDALDGRRMWPR